MNEQARQSVVAVGALAELCGELMRRLIQNGLKPHEALDLTGKFLVATITQQPTQNKEDI